MAAGNAGRRGNGAARTSPLVPKGSLLRLEFSPLPASAVPGYDDWLRSIGLVVHDVDLSLIDQ